MVKVKVWDRAVRLLHWTLVASLAGATLSLWWPLGLHQPAGHVALSAVGLRLLWGLWPGAGHARFASFVRSPRATLGYLRLALQQREPRCLGHNPLGGWMVLALMSCVAGLAITGWLYTSDAFWGDETVEQVHRSLAWLLLGLVTLHIAGVAHTSLRQRENLPLAMLTGFKEAPGGHDPEPRGNR